MADNLGYTPGTGAEVATDEIGGKHYQRFKLIHGADGVNDGDVSTINPLPIDDGGNRVSTANSSTADVDAAEEFLGTWEDVSGYSSLSLIAAFQSAVGVEIHFQWSPDGVTMTFFDYLETGSSTFATVAPVRSKYFRLKFKDWSGGAITDVNVAVTLTRKDVANGTPTAPTIIGGVDTAGTAGVINAAEVRTSDPTEYVAGLVTRNIPSGTQAVSAAALPLPTGAATSAKQDTGNSSLSSIDGKVTACNTGAVTVSSSALPSGAATGAKQDTGNSSLSSIDGKITACNTGAVVVSSSALPSGAATAAKQPALGTAGTPSADVISIQGRSGMTAVVVDGSGVTQPVSAAALPLPSGAATGAKQDTGNTSLSSIDGKVTACNTGAVVVSSSALPSGAATSAKQDTIIGHVDGLEGLLTTIDGDTGTLAGAVSGSEVQVDVVAALPAGANTIGAVNLAQYTPATGRLPVDGSGVTQPVSGTFWQATQPVSIAASVGVTGPLTDSELRATPVPVSGTFWQATQPVSGTFWQATQPVSIAATVTTKETRAASSSVSSVAGSASSVSLLASNANRLGATIYNDSSAALYVKLGTTASTSSFTVKLAQDDYYEVPGNYTGAIDGIWASATGNARITELT